MNWAIETWADVESVAILVGSITALFTAWSGLDTWQSALRGKTEFYAAHTLITQIYALRDALCAYRDPLWFVYDKNSLESNVRFLNTRDKALAPVLIKFDARALEAEALWGLEIKNRTNRLRACVRKVQAAAGAFISNMESGGQNYKANPEWAAEMDSDLYGLRNGNDRLSLEIVASIQELETFLTKYLAFKDFGVLAALRRTLAAAWARCKSFWHRILGSKSALTH